MRILIIEDNPKMAQLIAKGLDGEGFKTQVCTSGREGEDEAAAGEYDAIILDVMLADHDGVDLARNLRRRKLATPILMLTALGGTTDKVHGLEAGADDYLVKPFEFDELIARLRALTRRVSDFDQSRLRYDDLEIDMPRRAVRRAGKTISLTNRQFALLEYLVRNADRVLSRSQIGTNVWDMNFDPESNVIDVFIAQLRRKVDREFGRPLIHTVVGVGYMFSRTPPGQMQEDAAGDEDDDDAGSHGD